MHILLLSVILLLFIFVRPYIAQHVFASTSGWLQSISNSTDWWIEIEIHRMVQLVTLSVTCTLICQHASRWFQNLIATTEAHRHVCIWLHRLDPRPQIVITYELSLLSIIYWFCVFACQFLRLLDGLAYFCRSMAQVNWLIGRDILSII